MERPLRFGIFLAPFHPVGQDPGWALERDLRLIEWLDTLGYDEAWIGEHHSAGYEIIASPEVFIASAAGRTKQIRLGTGVNSLPYHHPFILADRMVLLDHLTHGRAMLGAGPGALPSDAFMMGIEVAKQRDMMHEALDAICKLIRTRDPVTVKTDWFELRDACLQLTPYKGQPMEIAVAAQISPAGPRAAGTYGCSLLSIGATQREGFDLLGLHWDVVEEMAAKHGHTPDRRTWRLVGPMHIADTREQAYRDVEYGLEQWIHYFRHVAALPLAPDGVEGKSLVDAMNESGFAVIGSPEDATAQIQRLAEQSGGFGAFLFMAHDWADREATLRSYELVAEHVFPQFQGTLPTLQRSMDWAAENREMFVGEAGTAVMTAIQKHHEERAQTQ